MNPTLPDEAVKAAQNAIRTTNWEYGITDADMAKALTAALPFLPVQVAVKKLEWTAAQNEAGRDGLWFIAIDLLGKKHEVIKSFNGQKGEGWTYGRDWFPALEAAKAAAQADHEARILSALEPSAARELALEEAARVAGNFLMLKTGLHVDKIMELEAAIRALSSPDHADAGKVDGDELPQDVINLVIAAREVWEEADTLSYYHSDEEFSQRVKALDKALEAFSERVPYENEPDELPSAPSEGAE